MSKQTDDLQSTVTLAIRISTAALVISGVLLGVAGYLYWTTPS